MLIRELNCSYIATNTDVTYKDPRPRAMPKAIFFLIFI